MQASRSSEPLDEKVILLRSLQILSFYPGNRRKKNKPTNFHRKYEQFSSSDIRRENCESFITVSMQARYNLRVAVLSRRAVLSVLRLTIVDLSSNMSSEKLLLKVRGSFKSEESTLGEKVSKAFDQNWTDTLAASNIGLYVVMRNLSC